MKNSFHGRTLGALSITAQEKYQAPFRPLLPDVSTVDEFTPDALDKAFHDRVCALVVEPIQGEAGIVPVSADCLRAARELCDRYGSVLILDEIQSGMGRTGKWVPADVWVHAGDGLPMAGSYGLHAHAG